MSRVHLNSFSLEVSDLKLDKLCQHLNSQNIPIESVFTFDNEGEIDGFNQLLPEHNACGEILCYAEGYVTRSVDYYNRLNYYEVDDIQEIFIMNNKIDLLDYITQDCLNRLEQALIDNHEE